MNYITLDVDSCRDGYYEFRRTIHSPKAQRIHLRIHTVGKYIMTINGGYVVEGPCRGPRYIRYFDELDVGLNAGDNEIVVLVLQLHNRRDFSSMYKSFAPQMLIEGKGEGVYFESDLNWLCFRRTNHIPFYEVEVGAAFVPPVEDFTFPLEYERIPIRLDLEGEFDALVPNEYGCDNSTYFLTKRPIPIIYPEAPFEFTVVNRGKDFIELDAGKYTTAKLELVFNKCDNIRVLFSEGYSFINDDPRESWDHYLYLDRTDTNGVLRGTAHRVHALCDGAEFKTFWFNGLRYLRIEAENIDDVFVSAIGRTVHYPLDVSASFECSDKELEQMFDVSINTIFCSTHEIFVDCPYYEQQQYQMDTAIEASCWMRMGADVRIVKKAIDDLASSQTPNGLLCANYPCDYTQVIPGFSFFWIFMLREYMDYYNDVAFAKKYVGVIDKILCYFDNNLNEQGLIATSDYWDFVDWVRVWHGYAGGMPSVEPGEAITTYNLYYICALQSAAHILEAVGNISRKNEYLSRIEAVRQALYKHCFNENRGLFQDGNKDKEFATHTIIWSIIAGLDKGGNANELFAKDVAKASFSMNYYLFRALEKCGRFDISKTVLDCWRTMLYANCTTWPEIPEPYSRSQCHGWSSAPIYEISKNILGVMVDLEDCIKIEPKRFGLDYARGSVPTRYGVIKLDIDYIQGRLTVTGLPGVEKRIKLENGKTIISNKNQITLEA